MKIPSRFNFLGQFQHLGFELPRENSRTQLRIPGIGQVGPQHPRMVTIFVCLGTAIAAPKQVFHLG